MKTAWFFILCLFVTLAAAESDSQFPLNQVSLNQFSLNQGWTLQSSTKVIATGEALSSPSESTGSPTDQTSDKLQVDVPSTVIAAQVRSGMLPDPFYAMNLRQYPGVSYPIGSNFSNIAMPPDSPYGVSWWYRKEFTLPDDYDGKTVWLNFRGINYRANIFLNGKQIANSNEVVGAWRTYEFNVTSSVRRGNNVLAVQVWAPTEESLAITFVDWNPAPPDKNMGLWREVYLAASGPVALRHPAIFSKVESQASANAAHLTGLAQVKNATDQPVKGTLKGKIETIEFKQAVELRPHELKDVMFTPAQYPQLNMAQPRLWWPAQMGAPNLYDLTMTFDIGGQMSDETRTKFGIREITSEVAEQAPDRFKRLFRINGKKILIRGGGWTPDMMLRETHERLVDEFRYVRDLGLNTVRLEGKLETEDFFNMADQQGILVMAGWCCCDFWEHWGNWKEKDRSEE